MYLLITRILLHLRYPPNQIFRGFLAKTVYVSPNPACSFILACLTFAVSFPQFSSSKIKEKATGQPCAYFLLFNLLFHTQT